MGEQLICNQPVGGSNPFASLRSENMTLFAFITGRWLSGQKQQTVNLPAYAYVGSNPALPILNAAGVAQLARASAFQAEGRGFDPRLPLFDLTAPM